MIHIRCDSKVKDIRMNELFDGSYTQDKVTNYPAQLDFVISDVWRLHRFIERKDDKLTEYLDVHFEDDTYTVYGTTEDYNLIADARERYLKHISEYEGDVPYELIDISRVYKKAQKMLADQKKKKKDETKE